MIQPEGGRPVNNDPERENAEQDESDTQAQDVASDALENPWRGGEETEHGGRPNVAQVIPDDVQDVVDHMTDMERSGRIDMDAFEGEENMDDEDGSVPDTGA
ncbi:hypothetical protein SLG_04620 [Sphingobium sp. SYK-6]|uniref:hypothetical protein n=1 Tax=Sphingobium sp. (strain NBRC 103272 / SYK-6) TaxID=627192 RepID=UPI0002276736|nr:hypothetical protein [Sphingobium sp. SYK-6]BAK65137.1 hypothetical protein SLG_04620 [Sphingobium sp. SYK-6]